MKTRLRLFRLAHMNDGHENGQASVLFLYSPPSKGFPCQRRAFVASLGVALLGTPKLALANSLIDAFIMRMGLAWLLAPPLGLRIHRNLCGAGSGAGSARPHRLRLPPAMGERKLAREAIALAPESFDL